ncbi:unnamed protein product, partial [Meganyctiphanes norvegica]
NKCGKKFINLGGECFYISTEHVNWWIAKETCSKMSAVLTTISTDTATNELLIQQELSYGNFWVGGRFQPWNSSYRWITTSEIINSGWQTGHPKHSADGLCVAFESQGSHGRGLIDWHCHNAGRYICKQVIKR